MGNVGAVVLAGGLSSRMGEDKAALPVHGTTLLEHMQKLLKSAGIADVYVSRANDIADVFPNCGPLSGVHATASKLCNTHDRLLYVSVDMPALTPQTILQLVSAPAEAAIVRFDSFMLPFRMDVSQELILRIEKTLKGGDNYSLKYFQQQALLHLLPVTEAQAPEFINCNTPEEWNNYTDGGQS